MKSRAKNLIIKSNNVKGKAKTVKIKLVGDEDVREKKE